MNFFQVRQRLVSSRIDDVAAEVRRQLDRRGEPPRGEVAVTVGSRGISNLVEIVRTAGEWLRDHGATPFVVPAMGSHNGATAEGQRRMVESLGCTEEATGMPIRSSMECVRVGDSPAGEVWMDQHCHDAAGVLVVNRVKLHTSFGGPLQSGLTKMMVVGMGKVRSAENFHAVATRQKAEALARMGRVLIDTGKVWAGLAILEDGYDQTAELHALSAADIPMKEPELLAAHRRYFPSLPLEDLNVLVVDQMGKTYSGTGMDPNVIGRLGPEVTVDELPKIRAIACLGLTESSMGNATGVGFADFITRRLRDAIDEHKTFVNVYTTGEMERGKIPATLADDAEVFARMRTRYGETRWAVIPNTLRLDRLWVTEDLAEELSDHPNCELVGGPVELGFEAGRHTLGFDVWP